VATDLLTTERARRSAIGGILSLLTVAIIVATTILQLYWFAAAESSTASGVSLEEDLASVSAYGGCRRTALSPVFCAILHQNGSFVALAGQVEATAAAAAAAASATGAATAPGPIVFAEHVTLDERVRYAPLFTIVMLYSSAFVAEAVNASGHALPGAISTVPAFVTAPVVITDHRTGKVIDAKRPGPFLSVGSLIPRAPWGQDMGVFLGRYQQLSPSAARSPLAAFAGNHGDAETTEAAEEEREDVTRWQAIPQGEIGRARCAAILQAAGAHVRTFADPCTTMSFGLAGHRVYSLSIPTKSLGSTLSFIFGFFSATILLAGGCNTFYHRLILNDDHGDDEIARITRSRSRLKRQLSNSRSTVHVQVENGDVTAPSSSSSPPPPPPTTTTPSRA
jgi:hypothetical protein